MADRRLNDEMRVLLDTEDAMREQMDIETDALIR